MNTPAESRGEILIVDDDPGSLRLLNHLLSDAGYQVQTASNGEQALLSTSQHLPDLIILDVRMPGMSGFDVSRSLQRTPKTQTIPVIFLSAAADPDDKIQGFDAGGVDFIAKPFVDDEVLARVKTHIDMAIAAKKLLRRHTKTHSSEFTNDSPRPTPPAITRRQEVLVVEDTPESLRLLATVLTEAGFAVREAPNGELALWTATRSPPDLILLDIRMPGMNGFDVCRHLKSNPTTAHVPVIFLSALSDREDKAEGFAAGAVDYVTKPFSEQEVLARVRTHLRLADTLRNVDEISEPPANPNQKTSNINLEAGIRNAMANGELELFYQPIIDIASNRLRGAEALLRWHVPGMGTLKPGDFLSLAEETGAIIEIGDWVIGAACAQLHRWQNELPTGFKLAINLSSLQFWQDGLGRCITRALQGADIPPPLLEFDIQEGTLYEDLEQGIATLHRLKAIGVGLAIDEFGAGDTRLSALRRFPIDRLKISRTFLLELESTKQASEEDSLLSSTGVALMSAVIALAYKLQWQTLAKGIENPAQLASLQTCECNLAQGYLVSRPVMADVFYTRFIKDHGHHLIFAA